MKVHQDFTSKKLALIFDNGRKVELDKTESKEFEKWFENKSKQPD